MKFNPIFSKSHSKMLPFEIESILNKAAFLIVNSLIVNNTND